MIHWSEETKKHIEKSKQTSNGSWSIRVQKQNKSFKDQLKWTMVHLRAKQVNLFEHSSKRLKRTMVHLNTETQITHNKCSDGPWCIWMQLPRTTSNNQSKKLKRTTVHLSNLNATTNTFLQTKTRSNGPWSIWAHKRRNTLKNQST